jgi:hypothetical protein
MGEDYAVRVSEPSGRYVFSAYVDKHALAGAIEMAASVLLRLATDMHPGVRWRLDVERYQ